MKKRIDITTAFYFPTPFIFLGVLIMIFAGVALLDYQQPLISLLLLLISLTIFTARHRFTINLTDRTYHDYVWIAGLKRGKKEKFSTIAGMHLTESAYRQTTHAIISSTTQQGIEYNGYIGFDDHNVHLLSDKNKRRVMRKLRNLQSALEGSNIGHGTKTFINNCITDYTRR